MRRACVVVLALVAATATTPGTAQSLARRYAGPDGALRVALVKQPLSPNGPSKGPATMAEGGIQKILAGLGATIRVDEALIEAAVRGVQARTP